MSLASRVRNLFRKPALDQDIEDELRFHIDARAAEYIAQGEPPEEAWLRARRDFGRVTQIPWLESFGQDLRFGARQLRRNPALAVTSILTLGLGMGATTAIFSLTD